MSGNDWWGVTLIAFRAVPGRAAAGRMRSLGRP
jgi:hypothetical protein